MYAVKLQGAEDKYKIIQKELEQKDREIMRALHLEKAEESKLV